KVAAYRAGFLDSKRKEIQRRLSSGELVGVVSTNALELGIDIGELDVVILDGFPGSVASFWQQAGRAGRGTEPSLVILVLRQNALDQYFAAHSSHLLKASSDQAVAECYPGAVYLSQGISYQVTNLDLTHMRVDLKRFEGNYYTKPVGFKELTLLDEEPLQREVPHATLFAGRVHIIDHITGYG